MAQAIEHAGARPHPAQDRQQWGLNLRPLSLSRSSEPRLLLLRGSYGTNGPPARAVFVWRSAYADVASLDARTTLSLLLRNSPLQFDIAPLGVSRCFPLRLVRGLLFRLNLAPDHDDFLGLGALRSNSGAWMDDKRNGGDRCSG